MKNNDFSPGRRWEVTRTHSSLGFRRARFSFVILGPGTNNHGKPDPRFRLCRLENHPEDIANRVPGYEDHGSERCFSTKHIKKFAVLADEETSGATCPNESPQLPRD
jgi:hypothetical protein